MKQQHKTLALWVMIVLMFVMILKVMERRDPMRDHVHYSDFVDAVEKGLVGEVTFKGENTIYGRYVDEYENGKSFAVTGSTGRETFEILRSNNITPDYEKEERPGVLASIFVNWGPILLLIFMFYFFLRQIQAGGGKAMSFGKSKAKMLTENEKRVRFADVAGVEEAKEELVEIVDFLKDPKKYTSLGGKIPKGVLLVGPPGTGKTLLAKAVAGEADVPFFSISGSDFVEMFVGVGASRVRDLFDQGKKNSPCLIFIDEIDAVGRHRGAGMGGGHDEREQTLNQLLVEMDGFESNSGVILIAATNRVDVLDPALMRPGRFDRRVIVDRPDVRGRNGILKVHTSKTPLGKNVNLETIAKGTPGFTGADLANLVNEAALLAAREGRKELDAMHFESAKDKVLMGVARKSMVISDNDKRNTAFHEAGHTIVGMKLPKTDPIHKVSIIPRGQALGVTQTLPDEDTLNLTTERAENLIAFLMGGRCAEELVFGEMTNGASNDIERATDLARSMICSWGMSSLGPVNYGSGRDQPFMGMGHESKDRSEETVRKIDQEIHAIIDRNYKMAMKILEENRDFLNRLSETLVIWETLDLKQIERIQNGEDIGAPLAPAAKTEMTDSSSSGTADGSNNEDKIADDEDKDGAAKAEQSPQIA